jgi:hypothetical protein
MKSIAECACAPTRCAESAAIEPLNPRLQLLVSSIFALRVVVCASGAALTSSW